MNPIYAAERRNSEALEGVMKHAKCGQLALVKRPGGSAQAVQLRAATASGIRAPHPRKHETFEIYQLRSAAMLSRLLA